MKVSQSEPMRCTSSPEATTQYPSWRSVRAIGLPIAWKRAASSFQVSRQAGEFVIELDDRPAGNRPSDEVVGGTYAARAVRYGDVIGR
ncbi:hypothetical protein CP976_35660 [Streptomyces coeruleorubidus]|uniref:Uncharacterized protein n=1 Tax=Streptomyces coeruleorubidus TaxID=116188 RepID=A0A5J6I8Z7_STRC4|nr:hypothetical protein CP976_35660 [Streptomyces coeruleorubidus]